MPKINFNVPFMNETGEPVRQVKYDTKKIKIAPDGRQQNQPVVDADGFAVQEDVLVRDLLVRIVNTPYEGDEKLTFSEKAKRGKLARKIQTSSTANYHTSELTIIQDLSAKAASTTLLAQLDDLINGGGEETDKSGASTTETPAAGEQSAAA